ncbi:hypothetical protein D0T12_04905 [Actinomadura spongiicola]|uniref:NB-ARC domain-containing protein n=1 Tax=Actinomadura spongiicola TaxID=2303421 RepID=A0A372GKS9_9ACTN|nr:NB-ARC domain-containing protein [Actinomadura spongiicola]RFS85980.1 hypothetical protein D0T12_04905 [Actinomadura spongiicola]
MVLEIFVGLFVEQMLSAGLGQGRGALTKRREANALVDETMARVREELPEGPDANSIIDALSRQLRAPAADLPHLPAQPLEALRLQLEPLLVQPFTDGRDTGAQILDRLGLDLDRLVAMTHSALLASARQLVLEQGGLPEFVRQGFEQWVRDQLAEIRRHLVAGNGASGAVDTLVGPPELMVGRQEELARLEQLSVQPEGTGGSSVVLTLHGMGGVGKTTLASAFAARISERFPDGRLWVDFHGFTPGEEPRSTDDVLAGLLRQVGHPPDVQTRNLAEKSELWRAWLADRAVLLVLDNALSEHRVEPLLPGASSRSLVLVTSRKRLDGLGTRRSVDVDTFSTAAAISLLRRYLPDHGEHPSDEPLTEISELCGHLPLALCAVGPLLDTVQPADLIDRMHRAAYPLQDLDDAERPVRAAFEVSYQHLGHRQQQSMRLCGAHPGPDFDAASLAALWGIQRSDAAVRIAELRKYSLLVTVDHVGRRFAVHDLFLPYVRELAAV